MHAAHPIAVRNWSGVLDESTRPQTLRKASMFRPISKELVFDVDLTDYDPIRTCCSGVTICEKCWQFITMAVKVVDASLRDDFGFNTSCGCILAEEVLMHGSVTNEHEKWTIQRGGPWQDTSNCCEAGTKAARNSI